MPPEASISMSCVLFVWPSLRGAGGGRTARPTGDDYPLWRERDHSRLSVVGLWAVSAQSDVLGGSAQWEPAAPQQRWKRKLTFPL